MLTSPSPSGKRELLHRSALLLNFPKRNQYDIIAAHTQRKRIGAAVSGPDDTIDLREVACQQVELIELCWRQLSRRAHVDVSGIRVVGAKARPVNLQPVAAGAQIPYTHMQRWRWSGRKDATVKWSVADLLLRLLKVPDNGRNAVIVDRSESLRVLERNLVAPDRVEIFVSKVRWLWDAFAVQQPEPAVERGGPGSSKRSV